MEKTTRQEMIMESYDDQSGDIIWRLTADNAKIIRKAIKQYEQHLECSRNYMAKKKLSPEKTYKIPKLEIIPEQPRSQVRLVVIK